VVDSISKNDWVYQKYLFAFNCYKSVAFLPLMS